MRIIDRGPNHPWVRLDAEMENLRRELLAIFLPIFRPLLDWLAERIGP